MRYIKYTETLATNFLLNQNLLDALTDNVSFRVNLHCLQKSSQKNHIYEKSRDIHVLTETLMTYGQMFI